MKLSKAFILRLVIGLGLLILLFYQLDWPRLLEQFVRPPLWIWIVAVLSGCLAVYISSIKLSVYLGSLGIRVGLHKLYSVYLIGLFLGNFLPSTIGGDMAKFVYLKKQSARGMDSLVAIFMERFTGLAALLFVAMVCAFIYGELLAWGWIAWALLAMNLGVAGGFLLLRNRPPYEFESDGNGGRLKRVRGLFVRAHTACRLLGRDNRAMAIAMVVSLIFVLLSIVISQLFAIGLGQSISWGEMALVVAVIQLVTMLPISINGIGVREWAYVYLLGQIGITAEVATAISLMVYLTVLLVSVIGGLLLAFGGPITRDAAVSEEL